MKFYGSIDNRIAENKNYTGREIKAGDDITMYYWSDRTCYYVTRVIDQKHIFVKRYEVCADHSKVGGMGHQNWLYFKTAREHNEYINKCIDEGLLNTRKYNLDEIIENSEQEWCFRYGHWYQVFRTERWSGKPLSKPEYCRFDGNISFGVRDYYYDWEF